MERQVADVDIYQTVSSAHVSPVTPRTNRGVVPLVRYLGLVDGGGLLR